MGTNANDSTAITPLPPAINGGIPIKWQRAMYIVCCAAHGALYELVDAHTLSLPWAAAIGSACTILAGILTILKPEQKIPGLSRKR